MTTSTSYPLPGVPVALSDAARRHPAATRRLTTAHAALVRRTRGSVAARWFGMPVLLLETVGRRSGRPRSTALVYVPDGEDLVVVAANAGAERPPAWWLNLEAAGEGVVTLGHERRPVGPALLEGPARERLWRRFAALSPVEHYQRRTRRRLPVVALTPRPALAALPCPRQALVVPARRPALAVA